MLAVDLAAGEDSVLGLRGVHVCGSRTRIPEDSCVEIKCYTSNRVCLIHTHSHKGV